MSKTKICARFILFIFSYAIWMYVVFFFCVTYFNTISICICSFRIFRILFRFLLFFHNFSDVNCLHPPMFDLTFNIINTLNNFDKFGVKYKIICIINVDMEILSTSKNVIVTYALRSFSKKKKLTTSIP